MTLEKRQPAGGMLSGYYDIDNDGISEFHIFKRYSGGFPAVEIFKGRDQFIDVIRPKGDWLSVYPSYSFGDYDLDSMKEVYLFTTMNDSIFLNAYELLGDQGHFIRDLFVEHCNVPDGKRDLILTNTLFSDKNGDGFEEMTFIIKAGFSEFPRRIYSLDIENRKLVKGLNSAAGYTKFFFADLDDDENEDFIALASAIENFAPDDKTIVYNDNSSWVLGFRSDLEEVLLELEFSEEKPHLQGCICGSVDAEALIVKIYERTSKQQYILKYNFAGELIQKEILNHERNLSLVNPGNSNMNTLVFSDMHNLFIYDDELKLVKEIEEVGIPENIWDDFGFRSQTGLFVFNNQDELFLLNDQMEEIAMTAIPGVHINNRSAVSLISYDSDDSFTFSMTNSNDGEYIFHVRKRRISRAGLLINIFLFLGFYAFFGLLFRIQYHFYNRLLFSEQRIRTLQLQTVQNQLQPHFTFNVLNTIGSLIYKDEKESAYEYLNHFSDMLRSALVAGTQTDWMIDEEIRFIKTYLTMENMRFDNKFSFSLEVSSETDISIRIPKLIIQTYVENAISHGLMHKKVDCSLKVNIDSDTSHIVIVVEDNGIGREAAEKLQKNNGGHGNEILNNYINLYNSIHRTKFIFTITDLFDGKRNACGTRVSLWIPKDNSKNISVR